MMVHLPPPISVNNLYANVRGKGRVRSSRYNAWMWQATAKIAEQKPLPSLSGPVRIHLRVGETGVNARIDTDNVCKAYIDCLCGSGIIQDDNRKIVRELSVEWVEGEGCIAFIWPKVEE